MSEWISVGGKLPKMGEYVLTICKHGLIEGKWEKEDNIPFPQGYLIFSNYYWEDMEWCATHWMPLPSPPEPPKESK